MTDTNNCKILFDEVGLKPDTSYKTGQWREIVTHSEVMICGFFGPYRFLSNFWSAKVFLDGVEYSCSETAYQAAKFKPEERVYFQTCTPYDAIKCARQNFTDNEVWHQRKLGIMEALLVHKFDKNINPTLYMLLRDTGDRYLEETNYWKDTFWGVHKNTKSEQGYGKNHLGRILMRIRDN